jgi:hypothetical protein
MHITIGHPRAIGHAVRQAVRDLPGLARAAEDIAREIIGPLTPPAAVGANHHGIAIASPRAGARKLADFCGLKGILGKPGFLDQPKVGQQGPKRPGLIAKKLA